MDATCESELSPARLQGKWLNPKLGLLTVAAANLVLSFGAMSSNMGGPAANAFIIGVLLGQAVLCGMLSAFSCRRPVYGLIWVLGYCTATGLTLWWARRLVTPQPPVIGRSDGVLYLVALAMFVILLAWRVFFGGRFETDPKRRIPTIVPFRLGDVLAWMFAFAFVLGLNSLLARKGVTRDVLAPYLAWLTLGVVIAVPWSLTVLSRPNWKWVLFLLCWTPVASLITIMLADGIPRPWYEIVGAAYLIAGILGIILVNSAVLRWFGFHWNRLMLTLVHVPSWRQQLHTGLRHQIANLAQNTPSDSP